MTEQFRYVRAVVLDWAGTTIDHGSRAPASVFQEIFRRRGVPITPAQAREPMGRAKRDHIATIARMPEVAAAWRERFGSECSESDVDAMYADFLPLQQETLQQHADLIPGVAEAVQRLRQRGLKIGSSTGYTHDLMKVVEPAAAKQGYAPDCVLCAEDAPQGRPAPFLLYEAAQRLQTFPLWQMVKVDDTPVGIEAGRRAGCWTIGITRTGNEVGLSAEEFEALAAGEQAEAIDRAEARLRAAGAHFVLQSVAEIEPVIEQIDGLLAERTLPIEPGNDIIESGH